MKVTVLTIITSALRTVPSGLERELEELEIGGRLEAVPSRTLFRLARILRRVLET